MWSLAVETMSNIIKNLYPKGGDKHGTCYERN